VTNPIAHVISLSDTKDFLAILSSLTVLGSREGPFTADKLRQLIAADTHVRAMLRMEMPGYFAAQSDPAKKPESDMFAKHMQLVHSHFASACQRYVMRKDSWLTTEEDAHLLHLASALAIANFGALVKWSYFLHETLKGTSWSELHALYYLAEQQGYHHHPVHVFGQGTLYNPSIQALYLRALVMDIFNPGSLTAAQIEIAEGWLSAWCLDYALETQYSSRSHLIYVDLAEHAGFHVVTPGVQGDTVRYLRADAMKAQIEEAKTELRLGKQYTGLGAGMEFPVSEHVGLLSAVERVYESIMAKSGNRIAERTQAENLTMEVVLGFDAVLHAADNMSGEMPTGLTYSATRADEQGAPERWKVHDYSASGFGLLVDRSTGECVPLQTLIALRTPGAPHWSLGSIVRKLTNRVQGQTLIGIEMLSFRPLPVKLTRAPDGEAKGPLLTPALYIAGKDNDGKRDVMVVRQGDFAVRDQYEVNARGTNYRLRLNRAVNKGTDWVALRFEVDNKR
jgi:cyclic-di-GMP-binding protein